MYCLLNYFINSLLNISFGNLQYNYILKFLTLNVQYILVKCLNSYYQSMIPNKLKSLKIGLALKFKKVIHKQKEAIQNFLQLGKESINQLKIY